jgi:hypothetical protein
LDNLRQLYFVKYQKKVVIGKNNYEL